MSETRDKTFAYHEVFEKQPDGSYHVSYSVRRADGTYGPRCETLAEAFNAAFPDHPDPARPTP